MVTYTCVQGEKEDEILLEKTGHSTKFTVQSVREYLALIKKTETEMSSQLVLEAAKMTNISEHNPFLAGLSEEQECALLLFADSLKLANACKAKLKEIAEGNKTYMAEVEEIKKQTGIEI